MAEQEPDAEDTGQPAPAAEPAAGSSPQPGQAPEAEPAPPPVEEFAGLGADAFSPESLLEVLRQAKVSDLLLSTVSTLASVAYGKLEAGDRGEAKAAIDAMGTILPLLSSGVEPEMLRDIEQALTNLRLAYADSTPTAQ